MRILLPVMIFLSQTLLANEKKGEGEGGGGGGEYARLNSRKLNLELQVSGQKKEIEELILKKNSVRDIQQKNQLVDEIMRLHTEYKKSVNEYNKVLKDWTYKFPEKGEGGERHYRPLKEQSIEQIEEHMDLDESLKEVKKMVEKKYSPFMKVDEQSEKPVKNEQETAKTNEGKRSSNSMKEKASSASDHKEKQRLRLVK